MEKEKISKGWSDEKRVEYILQCERNFELLKTKTV